MAEFRLRALAVVAWIALLVSAGVFVAAGVVNAGDDTLPWLLDVALWSIMITAIALITVPAPSGSRISLGIGGAVAASVLLNDPVALGASIAIALVAAWLIQSRLDLGTHRTDGDYLADALSMVLYGLVYSYAFELITTSTGIDHTWSVLGAVGLAGLAWFTLRAVIAAFVGLERSDLAGRYLWLLALADWAVVLSMFAAGALFGLAWSVMGLWALAVAILPYAFAHTAFERYSSTRVTYGQTIKALAQIPEVAGLAPRGHSTRTSEIAVAIAQEMGLNPSDVTELEYAALMHDVGRITLNEPAILRAGFTDEDIARWGAQIIAEAPYLQHVSELVRLQHRPYRSPGVEFDPDIPMTSKIIKIASAYDQAQIEQDLSPVESLERIHQGSAYEFDPRVAASLRRVLVYRGVIAH
ncbi:MAG: metal-dependent phosphohydrolase [Acidimicrobiia bacterium]|nr:MAG: metal-dependent phosphohydrolase [Acidimicrobiia bacterium]